jgi:hypothetical protein
VNYRPQFVPAPAPQGFHDEEFVHYFDAVSTPVLGAVLAAGATQMNVTLQLENDADFIARGIRIIGTARFQFREPFGDKLLSEDLPATPPVLRHTYQAGGLDLTPSGTLELPTVPIEPEIFCPAGSAFQVNIYNPAAVPANVAGFIAIFGVKRYAKPSH